MKKSKLKKYGQEHLTVEEKMEQKERLEKEKLKDSTETQIEDTVVEGEVQEIEPPVE